MRLTILRRSQSAAIFTASTMICWISSSWMVCHQRRTLTCSMVILLIGGRSPSKSFWLCCRGRCATPNTSLWREVTTKPCHSTKCMAFSVKFNQSTTRRHMIYSVSYSVSCLCVVWSTKKWWWRMAASSPKMVLLSKTFKIQIDAGNPQSQESCANWCGQTPKIFWVDLQVNEVLALSLDLTSPFNSLKRMA